MDHSQRETLKSIFKKTLHPLVTFIALFRIYLSNPSISSHRFLHRSRSSDWQREENAASSKHNIEAAATAAAAAASSPPPIDKNTSATMTHATTHRPTPRSHLPLHLHQTSKKSIAGAVNGKCCVLYAVLRAPKCWDAFFSFLFVKNKLFFVLMF